MSSRADEILGEQRHTGGEVEREERGWASGRLAKPRGELRGTLARICPRGEALHSQRCSWTEWPRVGHAFAVVTAHARPNTWLTERVTWVGSPHGALEFTAGRARYRLETER